MEIETEEKFCRICYCEANPITNDKDLISPCKCSGSVKYIHFTCLKMWRIKGKTFKDMNKCEQCHTEYNISGEKQLHCFFVSALTISSIFFIYCISTLFFQNILDALSALVSEITSSYTYQEASFLTFDFSFYLSCCMLFITLYKLFTTPNFFLIFNYIFTYWRLVHFEFLIDKIIFSGLTVYFIKDIYFELYRKIDGMYYYFMNINWDVEQQKI